MKAKVFNLMTQQVVGANVFEELFKSGKEIVTNLQNLSSIFALAAAVVAGFGFFLTKRQADESKEKIGRIIVGVVVILLAASAITWVYTTFGGKTPGF